MLLGLENYLPEAIRGIQYNPYSNLLNYAFWSILVLIILHLLKPKPNDKTVPSIMFFMKEGGKSKRNAFLQRLFNNLLFFLQLLVLFLLSFAVLEPFVMVKRDLVADNTVIVLDISASMSQGDSFEKAVSIAKNNLHGKISLVLVAETPYVVLERGTASQAVNIFDELGPSPFISAIGDSIRVASDILGEEEGRILVLSDFLNNDGPKPLIEKEKAEAKGQIIDFVNVGNPVSNIGIINVKIEKPHSVLFIKNFNFEDTTVNVLINGESYELDMPQRSIQTIPFKLYPGVNSAKLLVKDDIEFDNEIYISTPKADKVSVLLITSYRDLFLESALTASDKIELEVAEPPVIPELEHDIIIIDEIVTGKILPGTIKDIEKRVKDGASVIFIASDTMSEFGDLQPVNLGEKFEIRKQIEPTVENAVTKDIIFGLTESVFNITKGNDFITFAQAGGIPVLGVKPLDDGYIFYYGIEESDNFKLSPGYPIFWVKLVEFLMNSKELGYYNHKAGTILTVPKDKKLVSPDGKTLTSNVILDQVGLYKLDDDTLAVNFLSDQESDIFSGVEKGTTISTNIQTIEKKNVPQNLVIYAIIAVLVLMIFELMYIKYRGDI